MLVDNVFIDNNTLCFFQDIAENNLFETAIDPEIAKYFNHLGVAHYCVHTNEFKRTWPKIDKCPIKADRSFTIRDLTAKSNAKLIWPQKSYIESGVPWLIRMIRLLSKKLFVSRVPYIYMRDWQFIPYLINLTRFRILEKGTKNRAESIDEFLLRTVPGIFEWVMSNKQK